MGSYLQHRDRFADRAPMSPSACIHIHPASKRIIVVVCYQALSPHNLALLSKHDPQAASLASALWSRTSSPTSAKLFDSGDRKPHVEAGLERLHT